MFCPRCSTENGSEESYCRKCGLALTDVRLALQGNATESLAKLKSGSHIMNGGIATIAIFMLVAFLISLIGTTQGHPFLLAVAMINALFGAIVGLPLVLVGTVRVSQASRLLSGEKPTRAIDSQRKRESLNAGDEFEGNRLPPPGSVTDRTTLDLNRHRKV